MNDKILMMLLLLLFSLLLIVNLIISTKQQNILKEKLNLHNQDVIFPHVSSKVGDECYKPYDFFKMRNTGKGPCECLGGIAYTKYSIQEDYWLKKEEKKK